MKTKIGCYYYVNTNDDDGKFEAIVKRNNQNFEAVHIIVNEAAWRAKKLLLEDHEIKYEVTKENYPEYFL